MRQHAPDLVVELRLRQAAVIVRHQQEAAFQQVLPQPLHFGIGEPRRAGVLHQRERTPEQPIVGQPNDHGVGDLLFAFGDELHGHLRQLGEAHAEIDVGAGIVGAPALLLAPIAREHRAAEVEAAIVGRRSSGISVACSRRSLTRCAAGRGPRRGRRRQQRPRRPSVAIRRLPTAGFLRYPLPDIHVRIHVPPLSL